MTNHADGDKWHPDNRQGYLGHGVSHSMWPLHGGLAVVVAAAAISTSQPWFLMPAMLLGGLAADELQMPKRRDRRRS